MSDHQTTQAEAARAQAWENCPCRQCLGRSLLVAAATGQPPPMPHNEVRLHAAMSLTNLARKVDQTVQTISNGQLRG